MTLSENTNLMNNYPLHKAIIDLTHCLQNMSLKSKVLAASNNNDRLSLFLKVYEYLDDISKTIELLVMAIRFRTEDNSSLLKKSEELINNANLFLNAFKY